MLATRHTSLPIKARIAIEEKDRLDYMRRRRFSLDTVLRIWVNDPGVILLYEGPAIAAQHSSDQVTLINSQDESVTLYFDTDTHLPGKKILHLARSRRQTEKSGRRSLRELPPGLRRHGAL